MYLNSLQVVYKLNSVTCTVIFQTLAELGTIIAVVFNLYLFLLECKCLCDVRILRGVLVHSVTVQ